MNKEKVLTRILKEFKIFPNLKGYHYICFAVDFIRNNQENNERGILPSVTKILYPSIAEEFKTTPTRAERCIRHAIEMSWPDVDEEIRAAIFGDTISADEKPTNSEFIATIVEYVNRIEFEAKFAQINGASLLETFIVRLSKRLPMISPAVFRNLAENLLEEVYNGTREE